MTRAIVAGAAAVMAFVVLKLRDSHSRANRTVDDIETELNALDPITRAAVVARLSADLAKDVKSKKL